MENWGVYDEPEGVKRLRMENGATRQLKQGQLEPHGADPHQSLGKMTTILI